MYKKTSISESSMAITLSLLFVMFFISGFTALLYQVVWQRMLGLFSGSDVRSVTVVVASYLLGLGIGSLIGGVLSNQLSNRKSVQLYGFCNLGIAIFAVFSRFLFYDLLFQQFKFLSQSTAWSLLIVFVSLLVPTILMGLSLPLVSKAASGRVDKAAPRIGLLYGMNTLGSGLGTLVSGWYIIGTFGYEWTVYFGAALSALVGLMALATAQQFQLEHLGRTDGSISYAKSHRLISRTLLEWCCLVFCSGFAAISLEIIWFRILDTLLQSIAYTYAHLLAFILVSNALGSLVGAAAVHSIRNPRQVFLWIQAGVAAYALISIGLISIYWQSHPADLRVDIGYIDLHHIDVVLLFKYGVLPLFMLVLPNFLLGFYFPLVQKAVQTDGYCIGERVGLIQLANILGNTAGSLLTGLVLLNYLGTAGSLRLLAGVGLGFILLSKINWRKPTLPTALALTLIAAICFFPSNTRSWAALHGIPSRQYFIASEDSTGVAAITEVNQQGTLLASGQAQAGFPYMQVHTVLGSVPALLHPNPAHILIIGLGSGGTAHTAGVNPLTQQVRVIELLGAELKVLQKYAQMPVGEPLRFLFADPRYEFVVGDGRQELELADQQFDIIEADAIYPWRSRAGMLYSYEFFWKVRSHLAPGGLFVEWDAGTGIEPTFRSVFPHVLRVEMSQGLYVLMGSDDPIHFDKELILNKLRNTASLNFLANAKVNVDTLRREIELAKIQSYTQTTDGKPKPFNTDLFPRSEYYLNQPIS